MFPYAHRKVTRSIELTAYLDIPLTVTFNLLLPKFAITLWGAACAFRAGVPKTAINKESKLRFSEVKIRVAWDIWRVFNPASHQIMTKDSLDGEFGRAVSGRTDRLHDFRSFLRRYRIRHCLRILALTFTIARVRSKRDISESGITFPPLIRIRSMSGLSGD